MQSSGVSSEIVLSVRNLCKEFKGFSAVRDVDLDIRRGEIHALIGPNGAGKTTCFNLLTKFLKPTRGTILYNGSDITNDPPEAIAGKGLVRSFQISAVFGELSVLENVRIALQRKRRSDSFAFWKSGASLHQLDAEAIELLERLGLGDVAHRRAGELSYGRKRSLEIATTLALDPSLMLLDEPLAGLGQEDIERVAELIARASGGRTVLMVEHNLSVVSRIASRITVLARGSVVLTGSYSEVSQDPRVIEAYLGTNAHA
jgi:branched-chain amino acid transport system ATP-binding protein